MTWCEHCRDHYDEDHYDELGHKKGLQYGPTGTAMVEHQLLEKILMGSYVDVPRPGLLIVDGQTDELTDDEEKLLDLILGPVQA